MFLGTPIAEVDNLEDLALAPLLRGTDIMVAGGGDELLANSGDLLLPDTPPAQIEEILGNAVSRVEFTDGRFAQASGFSPSSKNHWDIPIRVNNRVIRALASHPTPPVFDSPEDRNGRRNRDEIRLWADYITPGNQVHE